MVEKALCSSSKERDRFLDDGYAIVAVAKFLPDGETTFFLEKGSDWSRKLGSK